MEQNKADGDIIDRLILFRKTYKISRAELGEKLGVSAATIRNYETRLSRPSYQCLHNLCDIYNVSRDWLINGAGNMMLSNVTASTVGERLLTIRSREGLSQDAFARSIYLSRGGYLAIEHDINNASDRIIDDVCRVYGVAEKWLRSGEGEMYEDYSEEQEMMAQITELLVDEPKSRRRAFASVLLQLTDEQIDMIADVINKLYEAQNNANRKTKK